MYEFQARSFIFEIVVKLIFGGILALIPLVNEFKHRKMKKRIRKGKKRGNEYEIFGVNISLFSIVWAVLLFGITFFLMRSYFFDIPSLAKGDLRFVKGTVIDVKNKSKDIHDYVNVDGQVVSFFLTGDVEKGDEVKIGYLKHTSRAIYCTKAVNGNNSEYEEVGFPLKDVELFVETVAIFLGAVLFIFFFLKAKDKFRKGKKEKSKDKKR
ncbi:hypothetical protein [Clostridium sp. YIM B02551]|uniref:hypothetical protein n=1 Tax=Clostridium sp. YIM B02551 TaxID=2910679 RepID=UPI001EEC1E1B|nr:hypothetical protein [Clostridium sp. YIM B02551]